jgi:hypothetical protein
MLKIHTAEYKSVVVQLTQTALTVVVAFSRSFSNSLYSVEWYVREYWTGKELKGIGRDPNSGHRSCIFPSLKRKTTHFA